MFLGIVEQQNRVKNKPKFGYTSNLEYVPETLDLPASYGSVSGTVLTINANTRSQVRALNQSNVYYGRFGYHDHLMGETGIPTNSSEAVWMNTLRVLISSTVHMGGKVACWAVGAGGFVTNYNMRAYTYNDSTNIITNVEKAGEVFEEAIGIFGADKFYINVAALEFGVATQVDEGLWSALYARGWRQVRIPFDWYRLQPTLNGSIAGTHLTMLKSEVARARAAGMTKIILDCHNYGSHSSAEADAPTVRKDPARRIGGSTVTSAHLADMWTKLGNETEFKNQADIEFDIMNEPTTMKYNTDAGNTEYGSPNRETIVEDMHETVKDALVAAGINNKCWYEGWNYAGIQDTSSHRLNGYINSIHAYIDYNDAGIHDLNEIDEENNALNNSGHYAYTPSSTGTFTFDNSDNSKHSVGTLNNT